MHRLLLQPLPVDGDLQEHEIHPLDAVVQVDPDEEREHEHHEHPPELPAPPLRQPQLSQHLPPHILEPLQPHSWQMTFLRAHLPTN